MGSTISPSELAKRYGCKVDRIHAMIRSGELPAINVASSLTGRPRWRIPVEAVQQFEERRSSRPTPPAPRRRQRRQKPAAVDYVAMMNLGGDR